MSGTDAEEIARLRTRVQRERTARLEAERSLRVLYLRQQDLAVVERTARSANESDEPAVVIGTILAELCTHSGWSLGHAFLREGDVLVSSGIWHAEDPVRHAAFRDATSDLVLTAGVGLPGRVLQSGQPVWIEDLAGDLTLARHVAIKRGGLRSGFGFPVLAGSRVIAVLECFSTTAKPPDERVLDVARQVAVQAGRSLERQATQAEVLLAQAELEATLEEFARSNRDLESFAYIASHDLQEPLRSMSGFIQLLARRYQGQLDERADEYIGYALDAAVRMQALVTNLLEYSRLGQLELRCEPVDLTGVLDETRAALARAIEEAGARVDADPLPTVLADPRQIGQVFTNLVGNAVKFRRADEPPVVHVSAARGTAGWTVVVEDNGIGIPAAQAEQVFEPFKRLHGRDAYSGTGIGLAICQKIVERHGGVLAVQPRPGGGSRFSLTLPDGDVVPRRGVEDSAAG